MRKMVYAATVILACMSAIPVTLISASLHSTADAAEATCEFMPSSAATGGFIQQEIDSIAHCNTRKPLTPSIETVQLTESMQSNPVNTNVKDEQDGFDENRSLCPAIPKGTTAEDFQYRAALEHCRYGF